MFPKIKLSKLQKSTDTTSVTSQKSTVQSKDESLRNTPKISIKKEIKQEYLPHPTMDREEAKCVDLSMPGRRNVADADTKKSIKREPAVPDSAKNVLNQTSLVLSSNLSQNYENNLSVHLHCLNKSSHVTDSVSIPSKIDLGSGTSRHNHSNNNDSSRNFDKSHQIGLPHTPKLLSNRVMSTNIEMSHSPLNSDPSFAPVQEQALDLSGLELLSRSVLQHANRIPQQLQQRQPELPPSPLLAPQIEATNSLQVQQDSDIAPGQQPYQRVTTFEKNQEPSDLVVQQRVSLHPMPMTINTSSNLSSQLIEIDGPESVATTTKVTAVRDESGGNTVPDPSPMKMSQSNSDIVQGKVMHIISSPSSTVQTSNYRPNFSLLCALAEQELLEDGRNACEPVLEKEIDFNPTHAGIANSSTSHELSPSNCTLDGRLTGAETTGSYSSNKTLNSSRNKYNNTTFEHSSLSQFGSDSFINSPNDCYNSDWTSKSNAIIINSPLSSSSYFSPLDLSLSLSKKVSSPIPGPSFVSTVDTSTETMPYINVNNASTPIKLLEVESKHECISINNKLLSDYDSSSSDNQNFEGFEDSSMRRTEMNMRRQLAVLERQYREKVRDLQRQYPKSKRKPGRPRKRKRCHSETSRRRTSKPRKHVCPDDRNEKPSNGKVSDLDPYLQVSSDEQRVTRVAAMKQVPRLTISGLKNRIKSSKKDPQRPESNMLESQSSSDEYSSEDEDEYVKRKPHRRWSMSFISSDRGVNKPLKLHALQSAVDEEVPPAVLSEDDMRPEHRSDSSDQDSKTLHTETSFESSDHEATLVSCPSSQKRKPGRPKKHSPTKKDATETIVAKKHKNMNFIMHNPSLMSSKSKVKPKLKAEVSNNGKKINRNIHENTVYV